MNIPGKRIQMIGLLLLIGALLLCVGLACGRYVSNIRGSLLFQTGGIDDADAIEIRSAEGWKTTPTGVKLTFRISSENTSADRHVYVRLTGTEGLSDDVTVTLSVDETVYRGVARSIDKDDALYKQMGAGVVITFDHNGHEMDWPLTGEQDMILNVNGVSDAALLRLTATER